VTVGEHQHRHPDDAEPCGLVVVRRSDIDHAAATGSGLVPVLAYGQVPDSTGPQAPRDDWLSRLLAASTLGPLHPGEAAHIEIAGTPGQRPTRIVHRVRPPDPT
jgi:hypothetical protein